MSHKVLIPERVILAVFFTWAVAALAFQVFAARGRGRKEYAAPAGSAFRGIVYMFTAAMLPSRKETVSRHPFEFAVGVLMHVSVFASMGKVLIMSVHEELLKWNSTYLAVLFGAGFACAVFLLLRRRLNPELRFASVPDDYFAISVVIGFLLLAFLNELGSVNASWLLWYSSALFLYMPFGKLRHAVFFFAARGELGARLGYRGAYPPRHEASV